MQYIEYITILAVIFISGCSDIKIEKQCFEPIHYQANKLFQSSEIRVEPIWVGHPRNDYLKDHNVEGHLSPYGGFEKISASSQLTLTGNIYKITPNIGERYIGRNSEYLLFEVTVDAKKYVISDQIPEHILLPLRCFLINGVSI